MSALTFSDISAVSGVAATASKSTIASTQSAKPGFGKRLLAAMIASRQRSAEIEIRRVRAMLGEPVAKIDYALLPFSGE